MLVFCDIESDGLFGPVTEVAAVNEAGEPLAAGADLDVLKAMLDGEVFFVFWHHWMAQYLEKVRPDLFAALAGRYACLCDIVWFKNGLRSIADITNHFLHKEHAGNAMEDAMDLRGCYLALKEGEPMKDQKMSACLPLPDGHALSKPFVNNGGLSVAHDEIECFQKTIDDLSLYVRERRNGSKPNSAERRYYRRVSMAMDCLDLALHGKVSLSVMKNALKEATK